MEQRNDAVDEYMRKFGATNGRHASTLKPIARIFIAEIIPSAIGDGARVKFGLANDEFTVDEIRQGKGFIHPNVCTTACAMNRERLNNILEMSNMDGDRPVFNGRLVGPLGQYWPDMNYISKTQVPFNEQLHNMNTVRIKHVRNQMTYDQQEELCKRQYKAFGLGEEPHSRKIPEVPEYIVSSRGRR